MNNERTQKSKNIIYAVIGVLTLMITITGATYAYYTFNKSVSNVIKGNMATVTFTLNVTKMTGDHNDNKGLIPMTNWMVEHAVTNKGTSGVNSNSGTVGGGNGICVDDNGNVVCQIYKINVANTGSASMFVDGFVTLTNGSGIESDVADGARKNYATKTTMRWAQVFCTESSGTLSKCSTGYNSSVTTTGSAGNLKGMVSHDYSATGYPTATTANQIAPIATDKASANYKLITTDDSATAITDYSSIVGSANISGNSYNIINSNYIRISDHNPSDNYTQLDDITSALVYNQSLSPASAGTPTGDSSASMLAGQTYYIVVWLSETGTNQTAGAANAATSPNNFFNGTVTFISSQGSEVTGKFSGFTHVPTN